MSPEPTTVAVVNDFELIVAGVARLLEPFADRVVVVDLLVREREVDRPVDVALFDTFGHLDAGLPALRELLADPRSDRVAVYTWQFEERTVTEALRLGVGGYLGKNLPAAALADAVVRVAAGERVVSSAAGPGRPHSADRDWPGRRYGLSERESEILVLIAEGHRNQAIAAALHLSPNSVKTHIRNGYRKLAVESRSQAVRRVLDLGMVRRVS